MLLCVLTSQSFPPGGQVPPCGGPSAPKTHTLRGLSPPRPLCGPRSPLATVWWPPLPSSPCRGVLPLRLTSPCALGGGSWFGCSGPNGPQEPGPALSTSVSQKHLESTRPVLPIAFIPGNGRAGRPWEPLPLCTWVLSTQLPNLMQFALWQRCLIVSMAIFPFLTNRTQN